MLCKPNCVCSYAFHIFFLTYLSLFNRDAQCYSLLQEFPLYTIVLPQHIAINKQVHIF